MHSLLDLCAGALPEKTIYRGVTTGCNDAFIIDKSTKDALVRKDPRSAEILKPVLRGRDVQRYCSPSAELWLILARRGIQIRQYPAILEHLGKFRDRLARRSANARWYELSNHITDSKLRSYKSEKLFWMAMTETGRSSYMPTEVFCNDKAFVMTGRHLKYLCGVLNSSVTTWFVSHIASTTGLGLPQWKKFTMENVPIPALSADAEHLERFVNQRLMATSDAARIAIEREIDRFVYELYRLDERDRQVIEAGIRPTIVS